MGACDHCGLETDRRGAKDDRTVCEACSALGDDEPSIRVSPMGSHDLELVLAWRSHPDVYRHSRRQDGPLDWEEHTAWFENQEPDRHDFVIHYGGRRVGVVSLDAADRVSIYLGDFSARGEGVATRALEWVCDRFEERSPLFAEIHEENATSKRLFSRCGFRPDGRDGEWLEYVYAP